MTQKPEHSADRGRKSKEACVRTGAQAVTLAVVAASGARNAFGIRDPHLAALGGLPAGLMAATAVWCALKLRESKQSS